MYLSFCLSLTSALLAAVTAASPLHSTVNVKHNATDRMVFAHFMVGIVANRNSSADYDHDMALAHATGIDAFALNIGTDKYNTQQLTYAYESAARNKMKVFISFDFAYKHTPAEAGALIKQFANETAQLKVDQKVFVSSFIGDGVDVAGIRKAAGVKIFFAPNFNPGQTPSPAAIDGALNWQAWDSDGANRAPKPGKNVTIEKGDKAYKDWLKGKPYIAPVSPWFSTHFGPETSFPKNWVYPSDLLLYRRLTSLLTAKPAPRFIELLTWNDYGESHYIGPLSSKHTDDGASKWANNMTHTGWLSIIQPFIAAFKANQTSISPSTIKNDTLVYWYRPTPKSVNCSTTDNIGAPPDGYQTLSDSIFVVSLLKKPGNVTIHSGVSSRTFSAKAGAQAFQVPMHHGKQSFSLQRNGTTVLRATSPKEVVDYCACGIYNFNAYVGTVPAQKAALVDRLDADGLANFEVGMKNATCMA